jgi:ABC-2 type transport system ATP-binding protein
MPAPIARVSGLAFEYPGVRALDDVSFTLEPATVTALVGPNGAGKSTLLRCLAGLEAPLAGAIEVAGVDVLEHPREAHRHLGYLSDFFGVHEDLTVSQCLRHAWAIHRGAETEWRAEVGRTAARLGLTDRLGSAAGTLSRGLKQRLAIGQAIIHAPRLLLLDEPAAGLDPEARHALATLFRELRDGGMTLVVSSHILAELDQYSTHMLVLRGGRIVEQRALAAPAEGEARRLRLTLAIADARLAEVLSQRGAAAIEQDESGATFDWAGDASSQAALLRELVGQGFAVSAFAAVPRNLHDAYLRTVAR